MPATCQAGYGQGLTMQSTLSRQNAHQTQQDHALNLLHTAKFYVAAATAATCHAGYCSPALTKAKAIPYNKEHTTLHSGKEKFKVSYTQPDLELIWLQLPPGLAPDTA